MLVDPQWLEAHLHDPNVRVIELDVNAKSYDAGHIDGAVLWNIYTDLKDEQYQPIEASAFERLVRDSGIEADSTVVFYGYAPAMGLWLMTLFGHRDVRLLNCSRDAWVHDARPWTTTPTRPASTDYRLAAEVSEIRADLDAVNVAISSHTTAIVDVRTVAEYEGERFWPSGGSEPGGRAGHVPSALHLPIDGLLDDRGGFKPIAELRAVFAPLASYDEVITYCTVGGRACTAWFALTYLLGHSNVAVYDGSFAQWGRTPEVAVIQPFSDSPSLEITMSGLVRKSLNTPEETRTFVGESGHLDVINLDSRVVGRATFMPGWRWSEHVKPIAGTASCQSAHLGYFVSGRMAVVMDDGETVEYGPGDFADMAPGHDAWIIGDEPCVFVDWQGYANYAKRA